MARHGIPTARFVVCDDARRRALAPCPARRSGFPVVVKADGLAAGKGVVVAADRAEAEAAVRAAMVDRQFGAAGARLVIEECLTGPEVSFFVLCDGDARGRRSARRRITSGSGDGDRGPEHRRDGRVRAEPADDADARRDVVMTRIVEPVLDGHARRRRSVSRVPVRRA